MQFIEIPPVTIPSKLELNNWIEQFVEPFPLIAEQTSFIMQCLNASSKLVFEQRRTTWDLVKKRLTKITLVFLNVELLILKRSQLPLHSITALPPLMPKNDMDLFSSIEQLDGLISSHSLYGFPCAQSMWISSSALEILTANRIERHWNVEFPHNCVSCPLGLTNTGFKKAL